LADIKIAEFLIKEGDFKEAKKVLQMIMQKFNGTPYINLASKYFGDILRKEGDFKDAIEYYRGALDNRRGDFNAEIQYLIGRLYEKLGDIDNAIVEYMKVGYIYPDSTRIVSMAQLGCAKLFEKQKKWDEAERLYEKLSMMDVEESIPAKKRLEWIRGMVDRAR
jgi:tetratricopeptide (TPR) repeat protein